jgi:hypothetical protein
MMRRKSFMTYVCTFAFAGACGSHASSSDPLELEELPGEFASIQCRLFEACLGELGNLFAPGDCESSVEAGFRNSDFVAIEAAIEAGVVSYDGVITRSCLTQFETLGCAALSQRLPDQCDDALAGDVPLGGPCSIDAECAGLAFCNIIDTCPGVCASRRTLDESCTSNDHCEDGLLCDADRCREPALAGDPCAGPAGSPCELGLLCRGATLTESGTCADPSSVLQGAAGEPCNPETSDLCDIGLSCVLDNILSATFECRVRSTSGEECEPGFPEPCPSTDYCNANLALGLAAGTCVPLPGPGDACLDSERLQRCAADLLCVEDLCIARKANGETCTNGDECHSETCAAGTCMGTDFCTGP